MKTRRNPWASQTQQSDNNDANGYRNPGISGALYPFGFGLSYTTFLYSNLAVTPAVENGKRGLAVSVRIKNTGSRTGDEVVQLCVKDVVSSVTTYESLLRGFERIVLLPGEEKTVRFFLSREDFALLDKAMRWSVEPGITNPHRRLFGRHTASKKPHVK